MTSISLQAGLSELEAWLDTHAEAIDTEQELASEILPRLGRAGVFRIGVPTNPGGTGGTIRDAIEAVEKVAEHSLAARLDRDHDAERGHRARVPRATLAPREPDYVPGSLCDDPHIAAGGPDVLGGDVVAGEGFDGVGEVEQDCVPAL